MIRHIILAFSGFLAGVGAGIIMGVLSDIAYRIGFFKSSLFAVDGNFVIKATGMKSDTKLVYLTGIPVHLLTSGVFGAIYVLVTSIAALPTLSAALAALYVSFLWLSMLFIALPMAGQGILGSKAGRNTWFEQLLLHILFLGVYYKILHVTYGAAQSIM